MPRAVWTPIAESELDDILFYISMLARRPMTVERIFYEIRDRVNDQAVKQLAGQRHAQAPEGWLYFRHKRWLIFYQLHEQGIEVLRDIDGVRDLPQQFRGE